ncbi:MAG: HNH endonuclease, partial [Pedobacter sp.]
MLYTANADLVFSKCRFPGCNQPATASDIDHTTDWQHGGPTNLDNLAHLCRKHHRLKHHTAWT